MKSVAVVALVVVLCLVVPSIALPFPYKITQHAILDAAQAGAASSPVTSSAWGGAVISFDSTTGVVQYTIVNNVANTLYAHIHGPAYPGQSAGVIVLIPGFESGANATVTGSVTLTGDQITWFTTGQTYFNIHTTSYPGGEIRGQILNVGQIATTLDSTQEGGGVVSTATGAALTTFNSDTNVLSVVLVHNVVNATLAHIHGPAAPGSNAGVVITLAANSTQAETLPIVVSATLTSDQVTQLNAGQYYYNVHSVTNAGGEIRGQINPIVNYVAELTGAQDSQNTDALGVGFASLYGTALWTEVIHSVSDANAAHIHTGVAGVSGGVTFAYTSPASPIIQSFTATSEQANTLADGGDYFNVHNPAAPAGIIRGQIFAKGQQGSSSTTTGSTTTSTTSSSSKLVSGFAVFILSTLIFLAFF